MAEKTRYSDAELEEFRAIILEKLELAQRDYELLKASLTGADGNDTDDTSPTYKVLEEGANTLSKEETTRLAQRQLKFIQGLQAALVRIENKTYGICRETGKLIPAERLRAVPHATLSIEAKTTARNKDEEFFHERADSLTRYFLGIDYRSGNQGDCKDAHVLA